MTTLDLGTLSPDQAKELLLATCHRIGHHAPELSKLCGYLPLALRVSASVLDNNDTLRVEGYLAQLADEHTALKQLRDPDDPTLDVEASLRISYDLLDSLSQDVLRQISVFPTSFDLEAAEAVVKVGGEIEMLLGTLRLWNLLEWDEVAARYALHDLVRAFALMQLQGTDEVKLRYSRYYAQVVTRSQEQYLKGGEALLAGLALFDRERTHIDTGWAWARERTGNHSADMLILEYADSTVDISDLRYVVERERIPQLEAGLQASQRLRNRVAEGHLLLNLGLNYEYLGKIKRATIYHEQALTIARELGDRQTEGYALGNLGRANYTSGEIQLGIAYCEQALKISRGIGDRRMEELVRIDLGLAYAAMGATSLGIASHEQALTIARELGDRREEGHALGSLGVVYENLGEMQQAIRYYEQERAISHEIGDRRTEGRVLLRLGRVYEKLGEIQLAITHYEQRLTISHEIEDRQDEARVLLNLGWVYAALGETRQAIGYYEQRLLIVRELENYPIIVRMLINLGLAYASLEEMQQAINLFNQALTISRESKNQYEEASALGCLGLVYAVASEIQHTIIYYEQAVTISRDISDWEGEARYSWNLSLLLKHQNEPTRVTGLEQIPADFKWLIVDSNKK